MTYDFNTPINRLGTYCTQWDFIEDRFGEANLLPFSISDMDLATAPCVMDALQTRLVHPIFGYSRWNHSDYKQAIQSWYQTQYSAEIDVDWIVYAPSVMYMVGQFIEFWSEPNDGVIVFTPAYDAFSEMIEYHQRHLVSIGLDPNEKFKVDWHSFEEALKQPQNRILLLCNPHNPTGKVWSYEELKKISTLCQKYKVKLISDDIHMDMAFSQFIPISTVIEKEGLTELDWIITTSASKSFNIPSLGGAYGFVSNLLIRNRYLQRLKMGHAVSSPSILGVIATISAYREGASWLEQLKQHLQNNLAFVSDKLESTFPELTYKIPEATYLAWIDLRPLSLDMNRLQHDLVHHCKVAIMDGRAYGNNGSGFVRLNVGCSRQKLEKGLNALITAINMQYID